MASIDKLLIKLLYSSAVKWYLSVEFPPWRPDGIKLWFPPNAVTEEASDAVKWYLSVELPPWSPVGQLLWFPPKAVNAV